MRPACYNRKAFTDPNAGWHPTGRRATPRYRFGRNVPQVLPVLRYRWPWFTDRCTLHDRADIGPGQTYPQAHGFDCRGCRLEVTR